MANNEIKTNAEIYREQRKERLAKAAKKKQHSARTDKIIRIVVKTVCIVLVAALVLWGTGSILTSVFCVPQKVLTAAKYEDRKISVAEYNYYYMSLYNQIYSMAYQYESYYAQSYGAGYGSQITGFDYNADPAEQDYPYEDVKDETVKTWADYFRAMAPKRAFLMGMMYDAAQGEEAKKNGFEISEADLKTIDEDIESSIKELRDTANENDFDLNNYIARVCGEGLTEKTYREFLKRDAVAQKYLEWYQANTADNLTDKEVNTYFEANRATYTKASFRLFSFSFAQSSDGTTTLTKAQAKAKATEFLGKITDEASFISLTKQYATKEQAENLTEDSATLLADYSGSQLSSAEALQKWVYDAARKTGEKTVIGDSTNSCYYVVLMVTPAHTDTSPASASVRHILFKAETTTTDDSGNSVDLDAKTIAANEAAAKKKADAALQEWKAGKHTEDSFAEIAKTKSEDNGASENGGLYEDINSDSSYVEEFLDWSLAPHKAGDTGIIKTEFGYHVMYFVKGDNTPKWESDIRKALATEKYNTYVDDTYNAIEKDIKENKSTMKFFADRLEKTISLRFATSGSAATTAAVS